MHHVGSHMQAVEKRYQLQRNVISSNWIQRLIVVHFTTVEIRMPSILKPDSSEYRTFTNSVFEWQ